MTIASGQMHGWLTREFPGIRLSRNACRYTAGGSISQHSAFGYPYPYHSNAIDILAPTNIPVGAARDEWLQAVYDTIAGRRKDWSIRLLLWQVALHYDHIHVDFYPTMVWPDKWCGATVTPKWRFSHGAYVWDNNPMPENGLYDGSDEGDEDEMATFEALAAAEFDYWSDQNIIEAYDAGMFQDPNRAGFISYWTGANRANLAVEEKARFIADYRAHLWKRGI